MQSDNTFQLKSERAEFISEFSPKCAFLYLPKEKAKRKLVPLPTKDMNFDSEEIIDIYMKRWEIELPFEQIKQNFPLKYFNGESANAIKIQNDYPHLYHSLLHGL